MTHSLTAAVAEAKDDLYAWEERLAAFSLWTKEECEERVQDCRMKLLRLQYPGHFRDVTAVAE